MALFGTVSSDIHFRNRIINGDMRIDQRNAGSSVTPTDGAYTLDRWKMLMFNSASKYTVQQNAGSVATPAGFRNYMGITSSSAYSVTSTDHYGIQQRVEGFNTADLNWGTASASAVTLSFWVRSSLTGTFGGSIQNSAGNRSYPFSYTVLAANTWEQKSITIQGDTSGTWVGATNGIGMVVYLMIGVGSTFSGTAGAWAAGEFFSTTGAVSVVGTSGATFYITGVQLEAGSVATPFERRPYGMELALCQRYFQQFADRHMGLTASSSQTYTGGVSLTTTMRATPTLASGASFAVGTGSVGTPALNQNATAATSSPNFAQIWNSADNWVTAVYVEFNGGLTSEL
jgi:hypothetical protein